MKKGIALHKSPFYIQIMDIFRDEYHNKTFNEYLCESIGKDSAGITRILKYIKYHHPDYNTEQTLEAMRKLFKVALEYDDYWFQHNIDLSQIAYKYYELRKMVKEGKIHV